MTKSMPWPYERVRGPGKDETGVGGRCWIIRGFLDSVQ